MVSPFKQNRGNNGQTDGWIGMSLKLIYMSVGFIIFQKIIKVAKYPILVVKFKF